MRKLRILLLCGCALLSTSAFADDPPAPPSKSSAAGEPGIIDWKDAAKFVDQEVIIQGWIVQARNIGNITFLNFDPARTVTAIVRKRNYQKFDPPAEKAYLNKFVRIRGTVTMFKDKPQIEIFSASQVQVLEKAEDIPEVRRAKPLPPVTRREFKGVVSLACYNVENLFDKFDDPYHRDETTDPKPESQLEALAKSIRSIDADVLALEEVENRGVLETFFKTRLRDMGYEEIVCYEGNDDRGIDVALVSRLPIGPVTSHRHVRFSDDAGGWMTFRRDLIQVRIAPPGFESFDVFVVHLKCCGGPEDVRVRTAEAKEIRTILDSVFKSASDSRFVICGDFNDKWGSPALKAIVGGGSTGLRDFVKELPDGAMTYNRPPHLSVIDFILASPALAERYVPRSYRVLGGEERKSASDHFPVIVQFDLKAAKSEDPGEQIPNAQRGSRSTDEQL